MAAAAWQPFATVVRGPARDADPAVYDLDADDETEAFRLEVKTENDETVKRETKLTGDERDHAILAAVFGVGPAEELMKARGSE